MKSLQATRWQTNIPPSHEMTDDPLFSRFLETATMFSDRIEDALRQLGLSRAKLATLQQLRRAESPVSLRSLAEGQGCVPSNMTTLVTRLENDGLVRRLGDPHDRRSVLASLTPLGADLADAGAEAVDRVQRAFAASLRPTERVALARILGSLGRINDLPDRHP